MTRHTTRRGWALVSLTVVMAVGLMLTICDAQAEVPNRLKRQIRIMEKIINEVLEDSPNILIHSTKPTKGIYLDGFGALFTFEASLVGGFNMFWGANRKFDVGKALGNWKIERDGNKTIIITGDHDDHRILSDTKDEDTDIEEKTLEEVENESREKQRERYEDGKRELIETLADYGETLTGLGNSESIAIAAYLDDDDFFERRDISRLVIRVKMSDLRAYSGDDLDMEQLKRRITVEEY